jgi:RNA polymerase sigma factor (sigma-70 family)
MLVKLSERQWANLHRGLAGEVTSRLARRREALIVDHMCMAERIARHIAHMFPAHIEIGDLVQAGCVGLVQAADRYRSEDGPFRIFAYLRVRGAIIDSQKRRTFRESLHDSFEARQEFDELDPVDPGPLPDEFAARRQKVRRLNRAMALLPDEQRDVLRKALGGQVAREIAASYGHSANWARVRLHAARDTVAARLKVA